MTVADHFDHAHLGGGKVLGRVARKLRLGLVASARGMFMPLPDGVEARLLIVGQRKIEATERRVDNLRGKEHRADPLSGRFEPRHRRGRTAGRTRRPQRASWNGSGMPRDSARTFGDLIGRLDHLEIVCPKCKRIGRYLVHQLAMEHGPDFKLSDWIALMTCAITTIISP